jgi:hypothetical protein
MASLSNINGIFDVHSTGAIQFNGNHGTAGQILKSNGNAAPTWVAASTVIGGPYLPLTGGTLAGAGNLVIGGTLTVNGVTTLNAALTGTTATFSGDVTAATFNTLPIETARNNNANRIVRTNVNGYVDFGWINTTSGATTSTISRIYASNDAYIRYVTPATFRTQITDPYYAPTGTVSGVTSVATGSGLTGGTITTTGTLSLDRPNSALGAVLATYGTTAGSSGRIRCTAPFNTNTGKMFSIEITLYGSYIQHNYVVSAYMYSTTNQWYSPKAIYTTTGTATPDIIVGRDANGKAYISIANANYTGVLVHNMTRGYQTSLADTYDPWTITINAGNENSVSVATSQVWTTANHTPGNYLPLSGGTMTGSINLNSNDLTNAGQVYTNGWFRNNNSGQGLYNTATSNHFYSDGSYWNVGYSGTTGIRLRNGHAGTIMGYLYGETSGEFGLLDKDGQWNFRTDGATVTEIRCNNTVGFQMDASGYLTFPVNLNLGTTAPTKVFMSNNTQVKTCDLATARAQFNLAYSTFRRYDYTTDTDYSTNIVGWGAMNLNTTIPSYGSGFWDQWGTAGANGQPSTETSHWNGSQAFHYVRRSDLANIYGYQTAVGAGDPAKMYVRGIWSGSSWGSWYRMHNDKTALIKINDQVSISTYNDRNLKIQGASSSDAGITGYASNGGHVWQLYGSGNDYGFLNGNWASWDLRKTKNGNLYMNNNNTYYLNTTSTSIFNQVRASIYYDSNDTTYYTRPSTYSYINQMWTAGTIQAGSSGTGNIYLGNNGISGSGDHFRFHTASGVTYFDMNSGTINWRQGSSTRYYFYPSTANMTINGTLTQYSDIRYKENIVEIPDAIDKIKSIRGVYYNRTDFNTEPTKIGVIAQEVEVLMPELILQAEDTDMKSVSYNELTAVLVQAIKEQQVIIDDLKVRVKELENK